MSRARILLLSANPASTARLALDEEVRAIQERLRKIGAAERIELCAEWALRADELPAALMRHRPQVVHFSGHGSSAGELFLNSGKSDDVTPVSAETLRRIFEPLAADICCVVLNACYSAKQAEALVQILPCVVGMSKDVKDTAAIAFAAGFYEALAFGQSLDAAFKLGCAQIELAQEGEQREIPKLLLRPGTDAALLCPFAVLNSGAKTKGGSSAPSTSASWPIWRRITAAVVLTLLTWGAGFAWWRSAHPDPNPSPPAPIPAKPQVRPPLPVEQKPVDLGAGSPGGQPGSTRVTVENEGGIRSRRNVNVTAPPGAGETVVKNRGPIEANGDVNIGVTAPAVSPKPANPAPKARP